MSLPQLADVPLQVHQESLELERRKQLNRSLRLLRQLRDAVLLGDPVPPISEIVRLTGLTAPSADEPGPAILELIEQASEERKGINRRRRLARSLAEAAGEVPAEASRAAPRLQVLPPAVEVRASAPPRSPLQDEQARLSKVTAQELDTLPYGAILMDMNGRIVAYNDTESRMARLPVEAVIGRNFFTEVAPCTRVKEFEGRFRELASGRGAQVSTFDFTFPFPFGAQHVSVMLTRGAAPGTVIMALLRR
ncbi:MAG: PAS domain-containing protein [Alphaproteobacteria bacterium]|nr:PAS domain-containing protein [Alphaproteobacteria bacterium]MCB9792238.1 PAS domain-containing protein [Alphaproteobacteria bacterium]